MVTRQYMAMRAMENSHHTVGRAFCAALGLGAMPARSETGAPARIDGDIERCFANRISPVDARARKVV